MNKIGILAYGSLIEDPGSEISPLIINRINNIETPFNVEFARSSSSRDGAPTLVPVERGGSKVKATILVLSNNVSMEKAIDLLWRRETHNERSDNHYNRPISPTINKVLVEKLINFSGIEVVLFTKIGANISNPTPEKLAELAINSAKKEAVKYGLDGISYLISVKKHNIITPLLQEYENTILRILGVNTLDEALKLFL